MANIAWRTVATVLCKKVIKISELHLGGISLLFLIMGVLMGLCSIQLNRTRESWKLSKNYFSLLGVRRSTTSMIGNKLKRASHPELFNGALMAFAMFFLLKSRQHQDPLLLVLSFLLALVGLVDLGTFPRGHVLMTGLLLVWMVIMLVVDLSYGRTGIAFFLVMMVPMLLTFPPEVFRIYKTRFDIIFQKISIPSFIIYVGVFT